jgi:hypothetical protein
VHAYAIVCIIGFLFYVCFDSLVMFALLDACVHWCNAFLVLSHLSFLLLCLRSGVLVWDLLRTGVSKYGDLLFVVQAHLHFGSSCFLHGCIILPELGASNEGVCDAARGLCPTK